MMPKLKDEIVKVLIEIDTSNDAFIPHPVPEVMKILQSEALKMKMDGLLAKTLKDSNGYVVGYIKVSPQKPEGGIK